MKIEISKTNKNAVVKLECSLRSSAYNLHLQLCEITDVTSLVYSKNKRGPRQLHCTTPLPSWTESERESLMRVFCVLLVESSFLIMGVSIADFHSKGTWQPT